METDAVLSRDINKLYNLKHKQPAQNYKYKNTLSDAIDDLERSMRIRKVANQKKKEKIKLYSTCETDLIT